MSEQFAVLDLGSNSFRLLIARQRDGAIQIVERAKEKVQLVRNFRDNRLDRAAIARAGSALGRFAQRLAGLPKSRIRMLGTQALRVGDNRQEVVAIAETAIGVPLEIIAGVREGELIYRGVQSFEPVRDGLTRLVIDIGGASTELILGDAQGVREVRSIPFGCVSLSDRFFADGETVGAAFDAAVACVEAALDDLAPPGFGVEVVGTSGTIEAIEDVLTVNGWSDRVVTGAGLESLARALHEGRYDPVHGMLGLAPERVDIFPPGAALLTALFSRLGIGRLRWIGAALEDGALSELLESQMPVDRAAASVAALARRFGVDLDQAQRVAARALALHDQLALRWPLADAGEPALPRWRAVLEYAAVLHEVGLAVAARGHHRHGAYLLKHSAIPGLSRQEHEALVLLVRSHRRSLPRVAFAALGRVERQCCGRLAAVLRLAVILERGHAESRDGPIELAGAGDEGQRLTLQVPLGWLARHPLSSGELELEAMQLAGLGFALEVVEHGT